MTRDRDLQSRANWRFDRTCRLGGWTGRNFNTCRLIAIRITFALIRAARDEREAQDLSMAIISRAARSTVFPPAFVLLRSPVLISSAFYSDIHWRSSVISLSLSQSAWCSSGPFSQAELLCVIRAACFVRHPSKNGTADKCVMSLVPGISLATWVKGAALIWSRTSLFLLH